MRVAIVTLSALLSLCGCDNSNVAVCISTSDNFCNLTSRPVADAGPDQNAVAGDTVVLDGSNSHGGLGATLSYAWTQTGGTNVTLASPNQAKASFVAPNVATQQVLTFRLTVVNGANNADSSDTRVTVAPAAPLVTALQLFDGALRPAAEWQSNTDDCPSATAALPDDAAAAQLGLWLAGRTLALVKGLDSNDPSQLLDMVRVMIGARPAATRDVAGQLESFGFVLFASALGERDPALQQAIAAHLAGAPMLSDPVALLAGRSQVTDVGRVAVIGGVDPAAATARAIERLRAARVGCIKTSQAVETTAAGLRVIVEAAARSE